MASIFTYDPDPPRVDSPWLRTIISGSHDTIAHENPLGSVVSTGDAGDAIQHPPVTQLEAEPQEGPVEYKLHLLLRPRRAFTHRSTTARVSGSKHSAGTDDPRSRVLRSTQPIVASDPTTEPASTLLSTSTYQSRQHRLQQLTTQLLWRLQQSSPHHASSSTNFILPSLPEPLPELQAPRSPAKLLHGLEESRGALYEIGVADDGTLVGLAEDEMQESLNNLGAMAACLGCVVEVSRREVVGACEWSDCVTVNGIEQTLHRKGELVVVEALVRPCLHPASTEQPVSETIRTVLPSLEAERMARVNEAATEQLRITLTGPTMSGKSSLLGTLTTSTLDNGRGKSRISMLKHRHEITSGVTSSVTQELIGYAEESDGNAAVINYADENIASWIDIHDAASGGRLVFISDSAGHPRYRRTTLRGLVGWAPHWTFLCVPADDTESLIGKSGSTHGSQQQVGTALVDMDLSGAQLALCLRLQLPLVIVITKLDLASKVGLKDTLTKVLDALKAVDRKPAILANRAGQFSGHDLQTVESHVIDEVYDVALPLLNDPLAYVPIVLTSAVHGTGVTNLHALLHELPIPDWTSKSVLDTNLVFHIEDVYSRPAGEEGMIVSGRMRSGEISVGDTGTIGPFSSHDMEDSEDSDERLARKLSLHMPTSRSFPGALPIAKVVRRHFQFAGQEWRRFKVSSIRNLRLPVHSLLTDQIGTLAIIPDGGKGETASTGAFSGIRKGMVMTSVQPLAIRTFVAQFKREDLESLAVGNQVVVYIASVRASARILSARAPDSPVAVRKAVRKDIDGGDTFDFDDVRNALSDAERIREYGQVSGQVTAPDLLVTFTFESSQEFVMAGDQVLVMPGGGPGLYGGQGRGEKGVAGLEGFVGKVTETHS